MKATEHIKVHGIRLPSIYNNNFRSKIWMPHSMINYLRWQSIGEDFGSKSYCTILLTDGFSVKMKLGWDDSRNLYQLFIATKNYFKKMKKRRNSLFFLKYMMKFIVIFIFKYQLYEKMIVSFIFISKVMSISWSQSYLVQL